MRRSRVDAPKPFRSAHAAVRSCQGCRSPVARSARPGFVACAACSARAAAEAGADEYAYGWNQRYWAALTGREGGAARARRAA